MSRIIKLDGAVFRHKRRNLGMTQSELAERSGTSQSAISMFEAGRPDALADDKLRAIAEILGIDLEHADEHIDAALMHASESKYCPNADCPCNVPYLVSGQLCVLINTVAAPVGEKTRCRLCGEVMESCCVNPECRRPVTNGAFCSHCGDAYITPVPRPGMTPQEFVHSGRERIRSLSRLAQHTQELIRGKALPCPPSKQEGDSPHVI